ncbi:MAG TPA: DUF559 domain-containing protein [Thermomicrobiales bacterium]|nr:DUF559 domain-containing protein [Thermomicrobiales bacterium]
MVVRNVVIGQQVADSKKILAKELRRAMTPEEALLWRELRTNRLGGPIHDTQQDWDADRAVALTQLGLHVIRFTNREVMNDLPNVLQRILTEATARLSHTQ